MSNALQKFDDQSLSFEQTNLDKLKALLPECVNIAVAKIVYKINFIHEKSVAEQNFNKVWDNNFDDIWQIALDFFEMLQIQVDLGE